MPPISPENARLRRIKNYGEGARSVPQTWLRYFQTHTDDVAQLRLNALTGLPRVPKVTGGGSDPYARVPFDDAHSRDLDYDVFGLQAVVHRAKLRDTPSLGDELSWALGKATAGTMRAIGHTTMASAYVATTSIDGLPLLDAAHTRHDGQLRPNLVSSGLDRTAFFAGVQLARDWVDYRGLSDDYADSGWEVAIPSGKEQSAHEIWRSTVSSDQNQANAAAEYNVSWSVEQCFANAAQWLMVSKVRKPFHFWVKQQPEFHTDTDANNKQLAIFSVDFLATGGISPEPSGIFGSDGA